MLPGLGQGGQRIQSKRHRGAPYRKTARSGSIVPAYCPIRRTVNPRWAHAEHPGMRHRREDLGSQPTDAYRRVGARLFGLYRLISLPSITGVHGTRTGRGPHTSACRINVSRRKRSPRRRQRASCEARSPHSAAETPALAGLTPTKARRAVFVQQADLYTSHAAHCCVVPSLYGVGA